MAEEPLAAYLVRGDDPALRSEAVRSLLHELVGEGDIALAVEEHQAEGDNPDTGAVADAAATPAFLTERRIVLVRDVGAYSTDALRPLLAYLADPLPTTTLVLVAGGGRGPLAPALVKAVKAVGTVVEAGAPRAGRERSAWLALQLKGAPVRLDAAAAALVGSHLGEDLGRLSNLLEALAAAHGAGARLGPEAVAPFLGGAGAVPPWQLTDAIDGGDTGAALDALHRMTEAGERHPLVVMAVLHGHYARLLRLDGADVTDDAGAAAVLGLKGSTFPAAKARRTGAQLGRAGVAQAITLLADADLGLRGGQGWPEELVLEVLVARLSRLARVRRS